MPVAGERPAISSPQVEGRSVSLDRLAEAHEAREGPETQTP